MPVTTLGKTDEGVYRLMNCMMDIDGYLYPTDHDDSFEDADPVFQKLFVTYRKMIKLAAKSAIPWWEGTIESVQANGLSREEAVLEAFDRRMAGPAAHPRVVWVVRMIWLICVQKNYRFEHSEQLRPEVLLLKWLADHGEDDVVDMLACMPYWPIGLDEDGNWC